MSLRDMLENSNTSFNLKASSTKPFSRSLLSNSSTPSTPNKLQKQLQSNLKIHTNNMGKYMYSFLHDLEQIHAITNRITKIASEITQSRNYSYNSNYGQQNIASRDVITLFPDLSVRLECKLILEAEKLMIQLKAFLTGLGDVLAAIQLCAISCMKEVRGQPCELFDKSNNNNNDNNGNSTNNNPIFTVEHAIEIENMEAMFSDEYNHVTSIFHPILKNISEENLAASRSSISCIDAKSNGSNWLNISIWSEINDKLQVTMLNIERVKLYMTRNNVNDNGDDKL